MLYTTHVQCTVGCTGPGCTGQDSLSQDISLDRSVSRVMRRQWRSPCLGSREQKLSRSHPSESGGDYRVRSVKVGQFQFSMNFPEIMQYYARMRPGHQRLFDNKSEKLGQSQESSRWPGGEKIIAGGRILFFIFISPCSDKKMRFAPQPQPAAMWKLITLTNAVWGWE